MKSGDQDVNFWPGYVDALITVLLNLLFLVGLFAVCLAVMQMQSHQIENDIEPVPSQPSSADLMDAVLQIDEYENSLSSLPDAVTRPVQKIPEPLAAILTPGKEPLFRQDIRVTRTKVVTSLPEAQKGSAHSLPSVEQSIIKLAGGERLLAKFSFDINQYQLSPSVTLPAGLNSQTTQNLIVIVAVDPSNVRLSRESFNRLMAVRNRLVEGGVPLSQIQVRIANAVQANLSADIERTVFVVALPD